MDKHVSYAQLPIQVGVCVCTFTFLISQFWQLISAGASCAWSIYHVYQFSICLCKSSTDYINEILNIRDCLSDTCCGL